MARKKSRSVRSERMRREGVRRIGLTRQRSRLLALNLVRRSIRLPVRSTVTYESLPANQARRWSRQPGRIRRTSSPPVDLWSRVQKKYTPPDFRGPRVWRDPLLDARKKVCRDRKEKREMVFATGNGGRNGVRKYKRNIMS